MRTYLPGTKVSLRCLFRHRGEPVDPDQVRLVLESPRRGPLGRERQFMAYGLDDTIKRLGPGNYVYELRPGQVGTYTYIWEYEPAPPEFERRQFQVTEPDE